MSTGLSTGAAGLTTAPDASARADADRKRIADAAQQFEAMFLLQMLRQMRQSMLEDQDEEPGLGAGTMFETIDAELSKQMAGKRGGLTPMLLDAMSKAAAAGTAAIDRGGPGEAKSPGKALSTARPAIPLRTPAALPLDRPSAPPPVLRPPVSGTPAAGSATVSGAEASGAQVTSGFGWRRDPFTGAPTFHAGVDIRASYGRDVASVASGTVVSAGVQGGYGQSVVVEHAPGLRTRYAHLSAIAVVPGQAVAGGAVLGKVGQSGRATGPHLHFEVLKNGTPVHPYAGGRLLAARFKERAGRADYPTGSAGLRAGSSGVDE